MRIVFQGDSITDAGRHKNSLYDLGPGYPALVADALCKRYPDEEFVFINRGVSGDRVERLHERWQADAIDLKPDILSILMGINDTWQYAETRDWETPEHYEGCYGALLSELKEKTGAKVLMLEQYLLPDGPFADFREDVDPKITSTRRVAAQYADAYVPLDGLFAAACVGHSPKEWSPDSIHPSDEGARLIAAHYVEAICPLIDELLANRASHADN